jgi:hypothetical protein
MTMNRPCFWVRAAFARRTRIIRSFLVQAGRFTYRRRTIRGFRVSAFSATSLDLLLARSVSILNRNELVSGFVQATKLWWSDSATKACSPFDKGENPMHSVDYPLCWLLMISSEKNASYLFNYLVM